VQHLLEALFLAMRQRLVVVSACSRFEAVYQGIATARGVCLWCAYGSMSLQPAVRFAIQPFVRLTSTTKPTIFDPHSRCRVSPAGGLPFAVWFSLCN
jgi:hypothetical protein